MVRIGRCQINSQAGFVTQEICNHCPHVPNLGQTWACELRPVKGHAYCAENGLHIEHWIAFRKIVFRDWMECECRDVCDPDEIKSTIEDGIKRFGNIDVLVVSASHRQTRFVGANST